MVKAKWSCLFISGKCNANCFYCPAPQNSDDPPISQQMRFTTPEQYQEYVRHFNFKGVGFSGGDPLLAFERSLAYLKVVNQLPEKPYLWLYTNGILASEDKFKQLADNGLNEIRFDIGATDWSLDKLKIAKGIIPTITIEVPAVPEEKEKIKALLPEMIKAGVSNLNLHLLRLTNHNAPKLLQRNYTFLHGEQATVLESELAALEIMEYANRKALNIGINYCSFHFKNRFQKAGFKRKIAEKFVSSPDELTERGTKRQIFAANLSGKNELFVAQHQNDKTLLQNGFKEISITELMEKQDSFSHVVLKYKTFTIQDPELNENSGRILKLNHKSYQISEFLSADSVLVPKAKIPDLIAFLRNPQNEIPGDHLLYKIWENERIESGFRQYF